MGGGPGWGRAGRRAGGGGGGTNGSGRHQDGDLLGRSPWGGVAVGTAADTGQQLRLFSQIQLSRSFSHGASFHIPVRSIIAQSSRPIESLGSPMFQWLQGVVGGGGFWRSGWAWRAALRIYPVYCLGLT